jgi:hypothetical protein
MFHAFRSRGIVLAAALIGATAGPLAFGLLPAASGVTSPTPTVSGALNPGVHPATNGPLTGAAVSNSTFAGYLDTPSAGLASASVTFKVPVANCAVSPANAIEYMGPFMPNLHTYAMVAAVCSSNVPAYEYVFSTPAASFTEPGAAAGDIVATSLFQSGTSTWAKIHDLTNGAFWFADDSTNVGGTSVAIGSFVQTPVASFAATTMSNVQVNGDYLGFESPTQYNAVSGTHTLEASSALRTTVSGTSFSLTFHHST